MTDTPASAQDVDDNVNAFLVADRFPVYLRKPTDGQLAILMLMAGVDAGDGFRAIVGNLGAVEEVMESLCIPPTELGDEDAVDVRTLKRMMARGEIELEDYFGPAVGLAEKWGNEELVEDNRQARRAAKAAPRKAATSRPVRTR